MRWKPGQGRSENIEDRRGSSAGGLGGLGGLIPGGGKGGGVIGVVVLLAFVLLGRSCVSDGSGGDSASGGFDIEDINDILSQFSPAGGAAAGEDPLDPADDPDADTVDFVSFVLDDVQGFWDGHFADAGENYPEAELVLFRERRPVGLRARLRGHRALLLPGRLEGLRRPRLLPRADRALRGARRLRPGLRAGPRARPPRPERAGHRRRGPAPRRSRTPTTSTSCPCAWSCRPTASPGSGPTRPSSGTCSATATSRRASTPRRAVGDDRLGVDTQRASPTAPASSVSWSPTATRPVDVQ